MDAVAVALRDATPDDIATLERWDRDPVVLAAHGHTTQEPDADWVEEFDFIQRFGSDVWELLIAVVRDDSDDRPASERPIGVIRIIDPEQEPTGYWAPAEPNLKAIDIWIGEPDARGQGFGTAMMTSALDRCFGSRSTTAVVIDPLASNERAIRFYRRVGFVPVGPRRFDDDDCLVMRIDRESWQTMHR